MKFNILTVLFFLVSLLMFPACGSNDLTRERAQKLITTNDEFQQIITLDYLNNYLKQNGYGTSEARSADEPEADSIQNRMGEYYREEPRVQIANFIGLVEPHIKRTTFKPAQSSITKSVGFWQFDETWKNTAKGARLWADYDLPAQETTVPLARKEFGQITGITKIDESQRGVDFLWKWMPNELGKRLDPATDEFKALPEEMQQNLLEKRSYVKESLTYSWAGERSGKAMFRKYDDGWRLEWVRF